MAHVVLGNPRLLLLLYKQTIARVLLAGQEVHAFEPDETFWEGYGEEPVLTRTTVEARNIRHVPAELHDTRFEVVHHDADGRCAVYARVTPARTQDDGEPAVWTGWSAYGAGAGLETDSQYHRGAVNTKYHELMLGQLLAA